MEKEKKTLKDFFKKIKIEYIAVAALVIIVVLIASSSLSFSKSSATSAENVSSYVTELESKLSKSLSLVKGAGKVEVIISVDSGFKSVYKESADGLVLVNGKPVVVTESYPEITGIIIVAEGANNLSVKISLLSAAQTFLSVGEEKIKILTRK
ncbi:MAG TPA: hypothetical protein DDY77_03260 [Clostridiales bacterium]|nr:hypothetical protein [Clostridiales bacterium]